VIGAEFLAELTHRPYESRGVVGFRGSTVR
jgi:hypothetical protein